MKFEYKRFKFMKFEYKRFEKILNVNSKLKNSVVLFLECGNNAADKHDDFLNNIYFAYIYKLKSINFRISKIRPFIFLLHSFLFISECTRIFHCKLKIVSSSSIR